MTAPERPAGLPEAFEWSRDAWVANTDDAVFQVEQRGGRWDAWERHSCATVLTLDTPRDALTNLLGMLEAAAAPHVGRASALRALLGEPAPEDDVARLLRELSEARATLEERESDTHLRIRSEYDTTVADAWRARLAERDKDLSEARAEVERLRVLTGDRTAGQEEKRLYMRGYNAAVRGGYDAPPIAPAIAELTTRAEKAEAERDALVAAIQPFAEAWSQGGELTSYQSALLAAAKAVRSSPSTPARWAPGTPVVVNDYTEDRRRTGTVEGTNGKWVEVRMDDGSEDHEVESWPASALEVRS